MQATLMNFGDNNRVVASSGGEQVMIGVGQIVRADIHEVHFNMIKQGIATDTLIAVPSDLKVSEKLAGIMELYQDIDTEQNDRLLQRFESIMGPNPEALRPTRDMMRIAMREVARVEVRKSMMEHLVRANGSLPQGAIDKTSARIREQGDETTRKEVETPTSDTPKKKKKKKALKARNGKRQRERL